MVCSQVARDKEVERYLICAALWGSAAEAARIGKAGVEREMASMAGSNGVRGLRSKLRSGGCSRTTTGTTRQRWSLRVGRFCALTFLVGLVAYAPHVLSVEELAPWGVDFRQPANEDPTLGDINWIKSILQQNNSLYIEGVSVPQRLMFKDFPATTGDLHVLTFEHQANKGPDIHAYDYLTSWSQAVATANLVEPAPPGPLADLFTDECGAAIGPELTTVECIALSTGGNCVDVDIPGGTADANPMGSVIGDDIDASIDAYEAANGNRTLRLCAKSTASPIVNASLTFDGYTGSGDLLAGYTLRWTSDSDQVLIEVAGHLAVGEDNATGAGIGYGPGRGAASINGGPYRFRVLVMDGASLGSQDNHIKASDIRTAFCTLDACDPGGMCDDGNACTDCSCDEINDVCVNNALIKSPSCEADGNLCTFDRCDAGMCVTFDSVVCMTPSPPCEGGEVCNPATGFCDPLADAPVSTSCEADGNLCTIDHCDGDGSCVTFDGISCPGSTGFCDAGTGCNPDTGGCDDLTDPASGTPCEADGNLCTIDACDGMGACETVDGVVCQAPNPPCEAGEFCDPSTGSCVALADATASTSCESDGNLCTIDHCDGAGGCVFGSDVGCSALDDQCNIGVCDSATGTCTTAPRALGTPCDRDGSLCTTDQCDGSGSCVLVSTVTCAEGSVCETGESCNPATGLCEMLMDPPLSTPCEEDGNLCTIEHCDGNGACVVFDAVVCAAPTGECDAGKVCNPTTGACDDITDPVLSTPCEADSDRCTIDHCDGLGACVNLDVVDCSALDDQCNIGVCDPDSGECGRTPRDLGTSCEADGDLSTIDECDGFGNCVNIGGVDCSPLDDQCNIGVVDPKTGECVTAPRDLSTPCERDGDLCTIDHCDGMGSCVQLSTVQCEPGQPPCEAGAVCNSQTGTCEDLSDALLGTACEADGDLCTNDHCDGLGACVFNQDVVCDLPQEFCDGGFDCNPLTGGCEPLPDALLSTPCERDGNLCTIDHCNGTGQCALLDEVQCAGANPPCESGQECEAMIGMCVDVPDAELSTPCEADGDLCTTDHCDGNGSCVLLDDVVCDDGLACTVDSCVSATGLCHFKENNASCDDSIACTDDRCDIDHPAADANGCVSTPNTGNCAEDGVSCSNESCDPTHPDADALTGCVSTSNDGKCVNDGLFCTGAEVCDADAGGCVSEGNPCHNNSSMPLCCENLNRCVAECCDNGGCDDSNPCTADTCTSNGNCSHINICGACCLPDDTCRSNSTEEACAAGGGMFFGLATRCIGDNDNDGCDDLCCTPKLPVASDWSVALLTLLLLAAITLKFGRRRSASGV